MTAWMLTRMLLGRPLRTLLLLVGFGIGVGVMITLLAVGRAVLDQAERSAMAGTGDVVLLPAGVDPQMLETGGPGSLGTRIEHARFFVRQVAGGPRLRERVVAASPLLDDEVVYLRRAHGGGAAWPALATGVLPSRDRLVRGDREGVPASWRDTAEDALYSQPSGVAVLREIDALHAAPADSAQRASWAEWQYMKATSPDGHHFVYVSFLFGADGRGIASVQVARGDGAVTRYAGPGLAVPRDADVRIGASRFTLRDDGAYAVHLEFDDALRRIPVRGDLVLRPTPGWFLSPTEVRGDSGFVSGYVVPVVDGRVDGTLRIGSDAPIALGGWNGYHDHNWGTWAGVHWDWGQAADPRGGGLVYGGVYAGALGGAARRGASPGLASHVAALYGAGDATREGGFLAAFRPDAIRYDGWHTRADGIRVPRRVLLAARTAQDSLRAELAVDDVAATPLQFTAGAARPLIFLQMHGVWTVRAQAGRRTVSYRAAGAAETFVARSK